ncbi:CocE/NonD family hydrolase [Chitinophaga nivalis]|uniref:CocE/NonD family hydrolase n=1 Tax=Chitinophaga nivalis TaxID=2991709 RepID=A0ABT3IKT1_9BACT|nr:CocE/NonD family hydrolase [Chitinophaga nivalis]MCW3465749.1 CocE/NonD family hydrolase [Chitinophaga nivalis]MCW3484560.1 CocE/NonD family hydrolase [Chitinophaga nivalis]
MKRLVFSLLCMAVFFTAHAQQSGDSLWIKENYRKEEKYITMRDGVGLFTTIYRPKDTITAHPVLLTRTPYSCAPYGADHFTPDLWNCYWSAYVREGYIIVIQDVRGRWMSEGAFVNVRPFNPDKKGTDIDEASDAYDTIDWLVHHVPGNNGKVGVFGISYPGFYATMAALSGHPALKAVSPQAPVTDWFQGDDFHHNGALFLMDCFGFFMKGFGYPHPAPTAVPPVPALKIPMADNYQTFLQIGPVKNFTRLTGDSIAFWKDLVAHPHYDDWWQARDARRHVQRIAPAVLVVGGLFDAEDCYGAWNLYKAIEQQKGATHFNKLVIGPWYHGQWAANDGTRLGHVQFAANTAAWYQQNIEVPFFNYYLKDKGSLDTLAEATVFFTGENQWHHFAQWPPAATASKALYLQPGGQLDWHKPVKPVQAFSEYISDPARPVPYTGDVHYVRTRDYMTDDQRFAARRNDVLTFETPPLSAAVTLSGPVLADLLVSISGTDADFVVKLIDVFPDDFRYADAPPPNKTRNAGGPYPMGGYQMLVRGEILRGKFRNSLTVPEAFVPGKVTPVKFRLPDVAHTFQKGHRIMIQIQSSWFPLADRNPQQFLNIYEAKESDFRRSTIRIYHDDRRSSGIILPVLP